MARTIEILDTTLRDGMQSEGISYSVEDKLAIVSALDGLGISYIEAGNPGSNPKDLEFFQAAARRPRSHACLCAFGSTRRKGSPAEEDAGLRALLTVDAPVAVIFGKSAAYHVTEVLGCTLEENLRMIEDTVSFLRARGRRVFFDAEHFFDGYRKDPEYALQTLEAAAAAGAERLVLCDTNGGAFMEEIRAGVERAGRIGVPLGIHCHDDCGLAAANTLAAVDAGAIHVQGTLLGFGERCGNACLATVIPDLQLKAGYACIPQGAMKSLKDVCYRVAELTNISIPKSQPYIGRAAFAHKAGMHVDGMRKAPGSFEHVPPEAVGNERRLLLSEMSGRSALLPKIQRIAPEIDRDSPLLAGILKRLKELELAGYQFEAAEASFELAVRKELGLYQPSFKLIGFKTIGEQVEGHIRNASAIVHVQVGERSEMTAAQGEGPVHALDCALRKALEIFYPSLRNAHLIDYKVRVLDHQAATASRVRVLITSSDGEHIWSTVGVSQDIIQASWLALVDSIEYKLICDKE